MVEDGEKVPKSTEELQAMIKAQQLSMEQMASKMKTLEEQIKNKDETILALRKSLLLMQTFSEKMQSQISEALKLGNTK